MTKKPTVAFCGPIAAREGPATGGIESGTRGIISELEPQGWGVVEFPYPLPDRHRGPLGKGLAYAIGLPFLWLRLLLGASHYDLVHLTVLYRHFAYPELLFVATARLCRKPVLLHLRPGDWWLQYQRRSALYRAVFRATVRWSSGVAVESPGLLNAMRSLGVEPIYIPSFVTELPRRRDDTPQAKDPLELVYVGALNDAKGLPTVLSARRLLSGRGLDVKLTIAGDGDPGYVSAMKAQYSEPEVRWLGPVAHEAVRSLMRGAHFFLFPTTFIGEGHSNALNECMAEGVVPVVSDHGANRHVASSGGVVLPAGARPEAYADAVERIWCGGTWKTRSDCCVAIIGRQFCAREVMPEIQAAYTVISSPSPREVDSTLMARGQHRRR